MLLRMSLGREMQAVCVMGGPKSVGGPRKVRGVASGSATTLSLPGVTVVCLGLWMRVSRGCLTFPSLPALLFAISQPGRLGFLSGTAQVLTEQPFSAGSRVIRLSPRELQGSLRPGI